MMKRYIQLLIGLLILPIYTLNSQNISDKQLHFLNENSKNITSYDADHSHVFDEVKSKIGDKRFVLIGEFNHGSKEVFLLRNEFIKYLNQNLEFNVVLFESGIGEILYPDFNKKNLSPAQMTYGFFEGWRTSEFRDLMNYIKTEEMFISGFDVQRTARSFGKLLEEIAIQSNLDSVLYTTTLESRFGHLKSSLSNRKIAYSDSIKIKTDQLIEDYETMYSKLVNTEVPVPFKMNLMALKTIENRVSYLNYMLNFKKDKDWNKRWANRDSLMADNVIWLSEYIYPNKKIIIVGHNFHISKYNEKEEVMGEYLMEKYPDEMYTIGVYAKAGKFLGNYGDEKEIVPAETDQLDIKHMIGALNYEVSFLHIPEKQTVENEWLHSKIVTNDTFVDLSNSNTTILSKSYDGLFLFQNISIPEK